MKTEKVNLFEQEVQLPCSRVVNGFRLCPFFSKTKKLFWTIRPNRSDYNFVFSSLVSAERFAKSYRNIHSSKFWYNLYKPLYQVIPVIALHDGLSVTDAFLDNSYCRFIYDAVFDAVHRY